MAIVRQSTTTIPHLDCQSLLPFPEENRTHLCDHCKQHSEEQSIHTTMEVFEDRDISTTANLQNKFFYQMCIIHCQVDDIDKKLDSIQTTMKTSLLNYTNILINHISSTKSVRQRKHKQIDWQFWTFNDYSNLMWTNQQEGMDTKRDRKICRSVNKHTQSHRDGHTCRHRDRQTKHKYRQAHANRLTNRPQTNIPTNIGTDKYMAYD